MFGILADVGCTVKDNTLEANPDLGILVYGWSQVSGNTCDLNSGAGIYAIGVKNTIIQNHCTDNGTGLLSGTDLNYFQQNMLSGNSVDTSLNGSTEGTGDLANVIF